MENLYRRDFIKLLSAGSSYLAIATPLAGLYACKKNALHNELYNIFKKPPVDSRPFYRWWWNGNRVTVEEVARELEIMKKCRCRWSGN